MSIFANVSAQMNAQNVSSNNNLHSFRSALNKIQPCETTQTAEDQALSLRINDKSNKTKIILNARGQKFEVFLRLFERNPESRLCQLKVLIETKKSNELLNVCDDFNLNTNEFYFNKNGNVLNTILDYYETGHLHYNLNFCAQFFKTELEYWNIDYLLVDSCCQSEYLGRIEDIEDRLKLEKHCIEKFTKHSFKNSCCPNLREKLWEILDDPNSNWIARVYAFFISMLVIAAILFIMLPTMGSLFSYLEQFNYASLAINCIFVIDLLMRFLISPSKLTFIKDIIFWLEIANIGLYIGFLIVDKGTSISDLKKAFIICRILIIFKLFRVVKPLKLLINVLKQSILELAIYIVYLLFFVCVFSSVIFYIESKETSTSTLFSSIPMTLWWGVITMTTVGYGDIYPTTDWGKFIGVITAITGIIITALPIGMLSSSFSDYYKQENLEKKIKNRYYKMKQNKKIKTESNVKK